MTKTKYDLAQLGYGFKSFSPHTSRTMMLEELEVLFRYVEQASADRGAYLQAITEQNCLGKRSDKTRTLTYRHLVALYSLDNAVLIFRSLRHFWNKDPAAQPLLALLCVYSRDSILRAVAPSILEVSQGDMVSRLAVEELLSAGYSHRFSKATLRSMAQNINSTLTKSGHLCGRHKKVRSKARASSGSVAYALFLGYLMGIRGQALFQSEYIKLLDCTYDQTLDFALGASQKGYIVFNRIGAIVEVLFPNLIKPAEIGGTVESD